MQVTKDKQISIELKPVVKDDYVTLYRECQHKFNESMQKLQQINEKLNKMFVDKDVNTDKQQ